MYASANHVSILLRALEHLARMTGNTALMITATMLRLVCIQTSLLPRHAAIGAVTALKILLTARRTALHQQLITAARTGQTARLLLAPNHAPLVFLTKVRLGHLTAAIPATPA